MATPAAGILPFGSPLFTQCTVVDKRPPDSTARTPFISPPDAQLLHLSDSPSQTPLPSSDSLMGDQAGKVHTTTEFAAGPTPVAIRTQEQTANVGPMIGIQALANDEHSDAVCSGSSTLTTPQPADTHSSRQGAKGKEHLLQAAVVASAAVLHSADTVSVIVYIGPSEFAWYSLQAACRHLAVSSQGSN